MPSATSSSTSQLTVANIRAHRRLESVDFNIKSVPLDRLMRFLSNGRRVSAAASANTPRASNQSLRVAPTAAGEDAAPRSSAYTGVSERYRLDLVENGIPAQLSGFSHGRFDLWGSPEMVHTRGPRLNLSLLTAIGMDDTDGATISIPTVLSDKQLTDYLNGVRSAILQLHIDYIADRVHTMNITCEYTITS